MSLKICRKERIANVSNGKFRFEQDFLNKKKCSKQVNSHIKRVEKSLHKDSIVDKMEVHNVNCNEKTS